MAQKERLDKIVELLEKNGFMTVKAIVGEIHYSTATVNRDLNLLQNLNILKRIYGGAELLEEKSIPLYFRYNKMRPVKNKIGKKATEFIKDGDTIFVDCSTTAQYIGKYIIDRKNLTVITNNISLASFLSEHNVTVICLGGKITEPPSMIYSADTIEMIEKYGADKMFFSAGAITEDGKIGKSDSEEHYLVIKAMMKNSAEKYLLIDREKVVSKCRKYLCTLEDIDTIITDYDFEDETKNIFSKTSFVLV